MDQFLINKWDGCHFGAYFSQVAGYDTRQWWRVNNPYFFLKRELTVTNQEEYYRAKRLNNIRHCKPYRGKWLDYVVQREFTTLKEWANDAGFTVDDILYGVNRVHMKDIKPPKYVSLQHLLNYLGYVPPVSVDIPEYNGLDRFVDILKELNFTDMQYGERNMCLVQKADSTIVFAYITNRGHHELIDPASKIVITLPYDDNLYFRLSDMPDGMTVYLRTSDGSFKSLSNLLGQPRYEYSIN
jgi:hypothetical protein